MGLNTDQVFPMLLRAALLVVMIIVTPMAAHAGKRVALVVGNANYVHVPALANPGNDATDMAKKLETLGFTVIKGENLSLDAMLRTVREFIKVLDGAELALFFYAGHGLQVNGQNYLAPVDAKLGTYDDLGFEAMHIDQILSAMERNSKTNLIFLDACRDNPLAQNLARSMGTRSSAVGRGLAVVGSGVGTLISFSTQPGNVALDGAGRNSPFTAALLKHLGTPGRDIARELVQVRRDVLEATGGNQVPWDHSSLTDEVVLKEEAIGESDPNGHATDTHSPGYAIELAFWKEIKDTSDTALLESYLKKFPQGIFTELALFKLEELSKLKMISKEMLDANINSSNKNSKPKLNTNASEAFLYEEGTAGAGATRDNAAIVWSLVQEPPADGAAPEAAIRGQFEAPGRGLTMQLTIKRNADAALSASHVIEMQFSPTREFSGGNVENVARFVMKANEQARGEGLVAVPARIDAGNFLIALNNLPQVLETNSKLLLESKWIDVPLAYTSGKRGLLALEKGAIGDKVFGEAFAAWSKKTLALKNKDDSGFNLTGLKPLEPEGNWAVQLLSKKTADEAESAFRELKRKFSGLLDGRHIEIQRAEVSGKGTFFRVRILATSKEDAVIFCTKFRDAGGRCFPTQ